MEFTITNQIITFFFCSLVNVMLSTCKTVLTIKASKVTATFINACTYGFYAIVVKQLANIDLVYTVVVTILTNIIGVYVSLWLMEKFTKDRLWKIELTVPTIYKNEIDFCLQSIPHNYIELSEKHTIFSFYCATQKESARVKEAIKEYDAKYFVTESKNL